MAAGRLFWAGHPTYVPMPPALPDQILTSPVSILYPPTHFLLLWPVIALPHDLQIVVWLGLYAVAVPVVLVAVYSTIGRPSPAEAMLVGAMFLASYPLRLGLENGEVELLIAALLASMMVAYIRGRRGLAGVALAAAILLKPTIAVLLVPFFLWKRAVRVAVAAVGVAGVVLVGTIAVGWMPRWRAYASLMGPVGRGTAWIHNQSVNGFVLRLTAPNSSGVPIAVLPLTTELAVDAGRVAVVVLLAWLVAGNRLEGAERQWTDISLALLALPLVQPYALAEHWTAALVVIPVAVRLINRRRLPPEAAVGLVVGWGAMMASNFVLFSIARHVPGPRLPSEPLALMLSSSLVYAILVLLISLGLGVRGPRFTPAPATGGRGVPA
ncbi:MAG TPA: glycosyltransferase 87 family protein [Candidatus Dormibacteraeota bacterium]|nr:glycosyltransferase 87 family protein [Candidatus Dormibacteraeota bacterium]